MRRMLGVEVWGTSVEGALYNDVLMYRGVCAAPVDGVFLLTFRAKERGTMTSLHVFVGNDAIYRCPVRGSGVAAKGGVCQVAVRLTSNGDPLDLGDEPTVSRLLGDGTLRM